VDKNTKSITIKEFKNIIAPKKICANCEWWKRIDKYSTIGKCFDATSYVENPDETFGCNHWLSKNI